MYTLFLLGNKPCLKRIMRLETWRPANRLFQYKGNNPPAQPSHS